jgi:hypothetical protein
VTHVRLLVVGVHRSGQAGAEVVRGARLPESRDIVAGTFDRQERRLSDQRRVDALAAPHELATGELIALEDAVDGRR